VLRQPVEIAIDTGHSQAIATLRCSFPEAEIGNEAQHFGGADDCNADKAALQLIITNVGFEECSVATIQSMYGYFLMRECACQTGLVDRFSYKLWANKHDLFGG
jgi:hypothetical protein